MKRNSFTLVALYAIVVVCFAWVFHGIDLRRLGQNLATVSWSFLLLAALLNVSIYFANAWRWKVLLGPVARVGFWRTLQATYIGVFANEALPLRPGEIVRCGLLSRWTRDVRFAIALSSATLERLIEAAWLQIGFIVVVLLLPLPKSLVRACWIAALALPFVTVLLVVAARRFRLDEARSQRNKLVEAWYQFINGIRLTANARTMLLAAVISLIGVFLNVLAIWSLMKTCGIQLPLAAAGAVWIILRVGTAIPNAPANVGPYQLFSVLSLGLFGVDKTAAATFALTAFAAFTLPLLTGGGIASVLAGIGLSEMRSLLPRIGVENDVAIENQ
jgi:glycosyltransferase 2 family protein